MISNPFSTRQGAMLGRATNGVATRTTANLRTTRQTRTAGRRFVDKAVSNSIGLSSDGGQERQEGSEGQKGQKTPIATNSTNPTSRLNTSDRVVRRSALRTLVASVATLGVAGSTARAVSAAAEDRDWTSLSDEEWQKRLGGPDSLSYKVLRKAATERPLSSPLNKEYSPGTFVCAGCGSSLFDSSAKYNSGTGWPSFVQALPGAVDESEDLSIIFMPRTEVSCHTCHGHLGHVFPDGPQPTGLRYCMNGAALRFVQRSS